MYTMYANVTGMVALNRVVFSSVSQHYKTPDSLYQTLDAEFHFTDDPCPLHGSGGLNRPWGESTYVNPPYGRETAKWIEKAYNESQLGKTIVCLIASRTDTKWWHDYVMRATEIRFLRGRLRFSGSEWNAPFPFVIVVFQKEGG